MKYSFSLTLAHFGSYRAICDQKRVHFNCPMKNSRHKLSVVFFFSVKTYRILCLNFVHGNSMLECEFVSVESEEIAHSLVVIFFFTFCSYESSHDIGLCFDIIHKILYKRNNMPDVWVVNGTSNVCQWLFLSKENVSIQCEKQHQVVENQYFGRPYICKMFHIHDKIIFKMFAFFLNDFCEC